MPRTKKGNDFEFVYNDVENFPLDMRFHGNLADALSHHEKRRNKMLEGFKRGLRKGIHKNIFFSKNTNNFARLEHGKEIANALAFVIREESYANRKSA